MLRPIRLLTPVSLLAFSAVLVSGCAGLNMQRHYQKYRPLLLAKNFGQANNYIDSQKEKFYGKKNRLLYYMDKAMVLSLAKRNEESNAFLEKAKLAAEELWTESVGEHAESWLTTDNSLSYQGEDFEKVLLHFIAAQNYLEIGDPSAARVEARQITAKLELYNSKYEPEHQNVYKDDAFARWLAGKLAETEGRAGINDAWIDYKKAIAIYEDDYQRYQTVVPTQLIADALRVLEGLGVDFAEDFAALRAKYPTVEYIPYRDGVRMAQIVLIHSAGEAPFKIDQYWQTTVGGDLLRIAFPKFIAKPFSIASARLSVGGRAAPADLAENITAIAIQNLADKMERIKTKAVARAVLKFAGGKITKEIGEAVGGEAGEVAVVLGSAAMVASAAIEKADKRSWITLPSAITLSQLFVSLSEPADQGTATPNPGVSMGSDYGWRAFGEAKKPPIPGTLEISIEFLDTVGTVVPELTQTMTVNLEPGKTVFLRTRTLR